ncbi:hypothetical protein [Nocardia cyriacigeorgica]|uniref:hypothetical protein n=1 Tax=Nocardia cyriacigeorgica TaxID=135487 RepID=UPI0018939E61|nr:hypothetical protein [Nocardia cyriacigeorgica]MBF6285681.1 hypothetical protein [Nocardia cyriacigeorgica]
MTTRDRDETITTITGAAPSVIVALRRAATIAAEHGHNHLGVEDLLAALLEPGSPLELRWRQRNLGALTFDEVRELAQATIPDAVIGDHGPADSATVVFEVSGRHSDEFTAMINQRS